MEQVSLYCKTPVGYVSICSDRESITRLHLGKLKGIVVEETPVIARAVIQLTEYFQGKRTKFDLPLSQEGTVFQQKYGLHSSQFHMVKQEATKRWQRW